MDDKTTGSEAQTSSADNDRRNALRKLGRLGAYTMPAMLGVLLQTQKAAAASLIDSIIK